MDIHIIQTWLKGFFHLGNHKLLPLKSPYEDMRKG